MINICKTVILASALLSSSSLCAPTTSLLPNEALIERATGYKNVAYFANWYCERFAIIVVQLTTKQGYIRTRLSTTTTPSRRANSYYLCLCKHPNRRHYVSFMSSFATESAI